MSGRWERVWVCAIVAACVGWACSPKQAPSQQQATPTTSVSTSARVVVNTTAKHEVIVTLDGSNRAVWGMAFLEPDKLVYTLRSGAMGVVNIAAKTVTPLSGVPEVFVSGQGGLLDVQVHPTERTKLYLTYSKNTDKGATTAVATATLSGDRLTDLREIFEATAHNPNNTRNHYGSRLQFDGKGHIFVTVGDRGDRDQAQRLDRHQGKVLRLNEDGTAPEDNPFFAQGGPARFVWSYGHRNPQGLVLDAPTGELWEHEHGPRGGDEINLVKKGLNYGWPVISYGKEYRDNTQVGEGTEKEGMEQPVVYFVPSIAPCGMIRYRGTRYAGWDGSFFSGALALTHLNRVELKDGALVREERLFTTLGQRFRSVAQGPDGYIYFGTDGGIIARVISP